MFSETVNLYAYFNKKTETAGGILKLFAPERQSEIKPKIRPCILILPGGGYSFLSDREGSAIALKFASEGYFTAVLQYSVNTPYPAPLYEACAANIFLRENSERLGIDEKHIAVIGFSAGGHLAGLLATVKEEEIIGEFGNKSVHAKPDAAVLSYPVVTSGKFAHEWSIEVISGADKELAEKLSVEKRIDKNTPPVFLWHTSTDDCVPVENSLLAAGALREKGVPFEMHIFGRGWHGLSLCSPEICNQTAEEEALYDVGEWFFLMINWLEKQGFKVGVKD